MICSCGTELIPGGDDNYDDVGRPGEGIASNFTCPKCGAFVMVYWNG